MAEASEPLHYTAAWQHRYVLLHPPHMLVNQLSRKIGLGVMHRVGRLSANIKPNQLH